MEFLDNLTLLIQQLISEFFTIQGGIQIGAVVACAFLALLTQRRWKAGITQFLNNTEHQRYLRFFLTGTNRFTFPLSMLLYLIIIVLYFHNQS